MIKTSSAELAAGYFEAWDQNDTAALRELLADDVSFFGPLAQVTGADEYTRSIKRLFESTTALTVRHRWVDGADVATWFDLTVGAADPTPVASWIHVENGKIARVQVTFDPRGML